jgi:hypothetical protein
LVGYWHDEKENHRLKTMQRIKAGTLVMVSVLQRYSTYGPFRIFGLVLVNI